MDFVVPNWNGTFSNVSVSFSGILKYTPIKLTETYENVPLEMEHSQIYLSVSLWYIKISHNETDRNIWECSISIGYHEIHHIPNQDQEVQQPPMKLRILYYSNIIITSTIASG